MVIDGPKTLDIEEVEELEEKINNKKVIVEAGKKAEKGQYIRTFWG